MGGQAFASRTPPLLTPRMPLNIYNQILKSTYSVLRQHFNHVEAPIEAPGKISYGDVDFLVCEPRSVDCDLTHQTFKQAAEALSQALNAKDWITERGNPTINMALPWPETAAKDRDRDKANGEETEEKFVQVDIHICPEKKSWDWELFHAAHGDLWNILGTTIRPFGLTADNVGLYLRIPEIELLDRKKSKIFLTDEPSRVLAFLGLDKGKWWTQFDNLEDMFRYAATCRMFRVKENLEGAEVEAGDVVGAIEGQEGGEQGKKKLKHNDRQRMAKRPIFAKWLEEFIPKCREEGNHFEAKVTREEIRDEAFEQFGVREQYETRLHDFQLTRHEDMMWREVLKGSVPVEGVDPQFRAAAIRTLKAIIFEGDTFDGVIVQASKKDENGFYDVEVVKKFVLENWRRAGEIGWKKQEERAREAMRAKAEKRKADEERLKLVSEKKGKVGDEDDLVKDAA